MCWFSETTEVLRVMAVNIGVVFYMHKGCKWLIYFFLGGGAGGWTNAGSLEGMWSYVVS
jgi:hypothetical protein